MGEQADAVRAGRPLNARLRCDESFYHIQLSEHGGRENGGMRPIVEQELSNRPVAHMRRPTQRALPVAKPPIPGSFRERWMCANELFNSRQVEVGHGYHLPHQFGRLGRVKIPYHDSTSCALSCRS